MALTTNAVHTMIAAGATDDQIAELCRLEEEQRKAWEATKIVTRLRNGRDVTVAQLREVFEKVQNPLHWKNPAAKIVPAAEVEITEQAFMFFHGGRPRIVWDASGAQAAVCSDGYAC